MIDIKRIRDNPEELKQSYQKKGFDCAAEIDRIAQLDLRRRTLISESESDKAEQNALSKQIPQLKKEGKDTAEIFDKLNTIKANFKILEASLRETEAELDELMLGLPNPPDDDLVAGGKENNATLRASGQPRVFDFEKKNHIDICESLGLIDYERGATMAGSGFWAYRGVGSQLEWALLNYFIDTHLADGYEFIMVPFMLEYQCGVAAGQFPKYADEVYKIANPSDERIHYMLPTAEAALSSFHRDEILSEDELPRKYFSYTPCFRREAGTHGANERGMVRGHQFNKVEMYQFTTPEGSQDAFDELVTKAEKLVEGLGFHFRTVKLAAGDCSALMARTYDIEIYLPSMNDYKEVSSVSNARCFQARRANTRFKRNATGKTEFVHTLNGSGLATSRIFPALLEQNQQADGSVVVPEVLRKYLGGLEVISNDR